MSPQDPLTALPIETDEFWQLPRWIKVDLAKRGKRGNLEDSVMLVNISIEGPCGSVLHIARNYGISHCL